MKTLPNDNAFAKAAFYHPDGGIDSPAEGLTKREYFAAMAMQAYINIQYGHVEAAAEYAVRSADALIEALNKEGGAA